MGLTATLKASIDAKYTIDNTIVVPTALVKRNGAIALTDGVGLNQADVVYAARHVIAASGTLTLDVEDGSLNDPLGVAVEMDKLKSVIVHDVTTTPGDGFRIGGAASDNDIVANSSDVLGGGHFMLSVGALAGYAATGGSTDTVTITNLDSSNAITVDVILIGASS